MNGSRANIFTIENANNGEPTMTGEECTRVVLAAILHAHPSGVDEEDLKRIVEEFRQHKTAAHLWDWVFRGDMGVKWDASTEGVRFYAISEEEACRRKQVLDAVALLAGDCQSED